MKKALIVMALLVTLAMTIPLALADPAHCKVTGGGWIIPEGEEDKGTFGFVAMRYTPDQTPFPDPPLKGELEYVDHNTGMNVHGEVNIFLYITPDPYLPNQEAVFAGTCKVNGEDGFTFWCDVFDNGEPGKDVDLFHIQVFTLGGSMIYDSGLQILGGGNIQTHPLPPPMNPEV